MKKITTTTLLFVLCISCFFLFFERNSYGQITTAAIGGKIVDKTGAPLPGAYVETISKNTGAKNYTATGTDGRYNIPNLVAGEDYKISVSMIGFDGTEKTDIYLSLGNKTTVDFSMEEKNTQLNEAVIVGNKNPNSENTIGKEQIQRMPTLGRNITEFTKLVPQSSNNSFAGTNFRYNNVSVDGAINNDAIGFSPSLGGISGTSNMPGSSTRTSPISLDALQEVQVQIAPFDIKLGNFTGGSINAVTRSGTNKVTGTAYTYGRNQNITGPDNVGDHSIMPNTYYDYQSGFSVGLPIIKNKVFFFTNMEITRRQEPVFYGVGKGAVISDTTAQHIVNVMENLPTSEINPAGGYNPGSYKDYSIQSNSNKVFGKIDYIINDKNRLMIRHNFINSDAGNLDRAGNVFKFSGMDFIQHNNINTTVAELRSTLSNNVANDFIAGYTNIHDFRTPIGAICPQIQINNVNGGTVYLGTDREAAVFNMKQKTLELTDNLTWFYKKHTFTFGTHNELYHIDYGFVNSWNGRFDFNSLSDFYKMSPSRMRAYFNLTDNSRDNNLNKPVASFNVYMMSVYSQDEIELNDKLKVTGGLRMDMALVPAGPQTASMTQASPQDANYGTTYNYTPVNQINNKILGQPILSPRVGFNYDVKGDKSIIIKGGTGAFAGRIPFAWLAYAYYNNGVSYGAFDIKNPTAPVNLPVDPTTFQKWATDPNGGNQPNGRREVDLIDNHFKLPKVWRTSLATDIKLPANFILTLEAIFTKTINDVQFKMVNLKDSVKYYSYDVNHEQPIYLSGGAAGNRINNDFSNAYELTNTNKGYRYNLSAQIKKMFSFGMEVMAAYTYGESKDIWNGIRNSPESNWQLNQALNPNNPQLSYSNFDTRHRVISSILFKKEWNTRYTTYVSLLFTSQSGSPYTYTYGKDITNSGQQVSLCYIPKDNNEIILKPDNANDTRTTDQIWQELNNYISSDSYLNSRKGKFTERNGARTPWNTNLDLRLMQDINMNSKSTKHTLQFTLDIINLTNLISSKWGRVYYVPNTLNQSVFTGLVPVGVDAGTGKTTFNFHAPVNTPWSIDQLSSRWQAQIGLRYSF